MPARRAAVQFEIGVATAIVWVRRVRANGERTARRQGQPRRSKLDPQRDFLLGLVEQAPDTTIVEMQQRLAEERGIKASVGTIWTFLDRCGLTFKKSPRTRRSGIGPVASDAFGDLNVGAIDGPMVIKFLTPIWHKAPETGSRV